MMAAWIVPLALAAAPLAGQPPGSVFDSVSQQQQQPVDDTTQAQDVLIKKDPNDRMTVAVTLSGVGPFRFLVDTGADRTAISSAVAARLGLDAGESATLHTMTGISTVRTANVPKLQLSGSQIRIDEAPVLEAEKMGADGILGTDSLRSQRVVFDFEKQVMTLVPSRKRAMPKEEGTIVVTGRLRNGRLIVTNAVADDQVITVVLDTGSEVSVGNEAMRRRLIGSGLLKNSGQVELESVTGDLLTGDYVFVKKLELGEVTLANLAVVFADAHTFRRLGLEDRPALLLGMNALRAFKKVSIDFANKKLRLMLPEHGSAAPLMMAAR
ncbi:MAG: aspartyl protease family protein [Alphaproteobacteria bacterium]